MQVGALQTLLVAQSAESLQVVRQVVASAHT